MRCQLLPFMATVNAVIAYCSLFLHVQSIFSAPDIQRQLPAEAKMFMTVDKSWKDIMRKVYKVPLALRATTQPGLLETFQNNNTLLDQIMKVSE